MEVKHGRGYVYAIEYHIVWCVKYRQKVLEGEIAAHLKELLKEIAIKYDFKVESLEVVSDHVHVLVSASPQQTIPSIVKYLKGISARKLFIKFPQIKTAECSRPPESCRRTAERGATKLSGGHLWNPSYFVATVSENIESQIKKYIESQNDRPESLQS